MIHLHKTCNLRDYKRLANKFGCGGLVEEPMAVVESTTGNQESVEVDGGSHESCLHMELHFRVLRFLAWSEFGLE